MSDWRQVIFRGFQRSLGERPDFGESLGLNHLGDLPCRQTPYQAKGYAKDQSVAKGKQLKAEAPSVQEGKLNVFE